MNKRGPHSGLGFSVTTQEAASFWICVRITDGPGCWWWTGTVNNGYGVFRIPGVHRRNSLRAHRIAFAWAHGGVPARTVVMHSCDNKRCVNPTHLRLGTQGDNTRDAIAKGLRTYVRARLCKNCGSPRWDGCHLALCRQHYLMYQRASFARSYARSKARVA